MKIEIPEEMIQAALEQVRGDISHAAAHIVEEEWLFLIQQIKKELEDRVVVEEVLQEMNKEQVMNAIERVSPGFNRFRLLQALAQIEEHEHSQ